MRFCIIGIGTVGPLNTRALMAQPGAQIVAVANRTRENAQRMCRELGLSCPIYEDWRQMLEAQRPDAAVINLYNDMHKDAFLTCARMGIHVLVEKPVANTYTDCLEMMEAAKACGIKASVLHTQRYGCVLQTAEAYIDANRQALGPLMYIGDTINCDYFYASRSAWHLDAARSGGGIVLNYGVHQLDRVHWLLGQKTVAFHGKYLAGKPGVEVPGSYVMMGVGNGGTPYTVSCNGYSGPWINELVLSYLNGTVKCVLMGNGQADMGVYVSDADGAALRRIELTCQDGTGNHDMYRREMEEAVAYLEGKQETAPIPLEWGAEMVRLCGLGFEEEA